MPQPQRGDLALARRARDRVDRGEARTLDVEVLARDLGTTAGVLERLFRLAFGESLCSYAESPRRRIG